MAQIKAHEFDRFVTSGKGKHTLFLFYGPDRGLVSERAEKLAGTTGVDLTDPFAVIRLDGDALRADPARLADEAGAIGLFGSDRLVRVRAAGNDRGFATVVGELARTPLSGCKIIIEAGELKKGAALRKAVEDAPAGLAIPCYSDERRDTQALIDEELGRAGLRITPGARDRLQDLLGGDRLASRGELAKLALYCHGREQVSEEDVLASVGDAAGISADDALDAVLTGNLTGLDQALQRIIASKTAVSTVLIACLRQFQTLDVLAAEMHASRRRPSEILAKSGRQIHFRRKPAVERALGLWSPAALDRALLHIQRAILEARQKPVLEDDIARHALFALAQRSAKSG